MPVFRRRRRLAPIEHPKDAWVTVEIIEHRRLHDHAPPLREGGQVSAVQMLLRKGEHTAVEKGAMDHGKLRIA